MIGLPRSPRPYSRPATRAARRTLFAVALLSCGSAFLAVSPAKAQQPVFFDGFLADNGAMPAPNFNAFFLWDVTDGTVDLAEDTSSLDLLNRRFVDLDGSTNDAGRFATRLPITFLANTTYVLTLDFNSVDGNANAATVNIGNLSYSITGNSQTFQPFTQEFTFPVTTNATLAFQDSGNDSAGIGIDNVTVAPVGVAAVPEPSALALLVPAAALGAVTYRRRRRRKSA